MKASGEMRGKIRDGDQLRAEEKPAFLEAVQALVLGEEVTMAIEDHANSPRRLLLHGEEKNALTGARELPSCSGREVSGRALAVLENHEGFRFRGRRTRVKGVVELARVSHHVKGTHPSRLFSLRFAL